MARKFDWIKSCSGNAAHKKSFHLTAASRLRMLADELGLEKGTYDVHPNKGGPAVSGEITLHHEKVYVQVSQSSGGPAMGILIRSCKGRQDYTGGPNSFAHISYLDDIEDLARKVKRVVPALDTTPDQDPSIGPAVGMRF